MKEEPIIKKYFKDENLSAQPVYCAKNSYSPVYINQSLYEELFGEIYAWKSACEKISDFFSITLNKNNSNGEIKGIGYADKQYDPMGISLSGNLGSGRAYFYNKHFNIKGDKTLLAVSSKPNFSNGKFALSAAIRETIISNILSKESVIPTFETLAILDVHETFKFTSEYLENDDSIRTEDFILPTAIEIRINRDKELYRISNAFINRDSFSNDEIKEFGGKISQLEAYKFCHRFLHGSWSVGNITTNANLIDFDTSNFVKGRHPQYSNTNKYKSNYFGFEILGNIIVAKSFIDLVNDSGDKEKLESELQEIIKEKYNHFLIVYFCDLLGLEYNHYYNKYKKHIDTLFQSFNFLSRKFLLNYYDLNVADENCDETFVYNFSNFFQNYLLRKEYEDKADILTGIRLLINKTVRVEYDKIGSMKGRVSEFFSEYIDSENVTISINEAITFINNYDSLFRLIDKKELNYIKLKSYLINADRDYLYSKINIYWELLVLYTSNVINSKTLNAILNAVIKTNIRKIDLRSEEKYLTGLTLYKDFLTYFEVSPNSINLVVESFSNFDIRFIKLKINTWEYMVSYDNKKEIWISENLSQKNIADTFNMDIEFIINGMLYKKEMLIEK